MNVFIIGATGVVGKKTVKQLLLSPIVKSLTIFARRPLDFSSFETKIKNKAKQIILDDLSNFTEDLSGFNVGISCLGTTYAQAGSRENFFKIDHQITFNIAKQFKDSAKLLKKHFILLSSQGSNKRSYSLYPKTKGLLERDILALHFEHTTIIKPALLLLDDGEEREVSRFAEKVAVTICGWLGNPINVSVKAGDVAKVIVNRVEVADVRLNRYTDQVIENLQIHEIISKL